MPHYSFSGCTDSPAFPCAPSEDPSRLCRLVRLPKLLLRWEQYSRALWCDRKLCFPPGKSLRSRIVNVSAPVRVRGLSGVTPFAFVAVRLFLDPQIRSYSSYDCVLQETPRELWRLWFVLSILNFRRDVCALVKPHGVLTHPPIHLRHPPVTEGERDTWLLWQAEGS